MIQKPSIVLLTCDFNEELAQLSKTAIESINYSVPDRELVLIDNASIYGGAFSRSEADIYIRNKVNVGYPAAVNQGMALAHGELIAIANNDIKVSPNWWVVAQGIMERNPKVGSVHFRMNGYDEERLVGAEEWIGGKEKWCSSSFFVIRKEAFNSVSGYDEGYKEGGYDDWDFWHRIRSKGWIQAYTNKAAYFHKHSSTYKALDDGKNREERAQRNREHFKSKFGEYAEIMFAKQFPEQIGIEWLPMP